MSGDKKLSATAAIAANLGRVGAHAPPAPEKSAADLFAAELADFDGQAIAPPVKRGAGRPAGSPNRTTLQLQKMLMARGYRDPAEFLAAVMSMDTCELAARLGCEPAEAIKHQLRAAGELLPYFHQRMPLAVEHTGEGARPVIVISDQAFVQVQAGAMQSADAGKIIEQEQALMRGVVMSSHGSSSHEVNNAE